MKTKDVEHLLASGDIVCCPVCGELSAFSWQDTTAYPEGEPIHRGMKLEPGTIAHVGACSCWEWECGHCGAHLVEVDSTINHPAYTHADTQEEDLP